MNTYEESQYEAIKKWQKEEPWIVTQAVCTVFRPVTWGDGKNHSTKSYRKCIDRL